MKFFKRYHGRFLELFLYFRMNDDFVNEVMAGRLMRLNCDISDSELAISKTSGFKINKKNSPK